MEADRERDQRASTDAGERRRTAALTMSSRKAHRPLTSQPTDRRGFGHISQEFWQSAEKLRRESARHTLPNSRSFMIIPAICLFHAALECWMNEHLAVLAGRRARVGQHDQSNAALRVQDKTLNADKVATFLQEFGLSDRFSAEVRTNTVAFVEFRNRLYHYSPELRSLSDCPEAALEVFRLSGAEVGNGHWTYYAAQQRVGDWCGQCVRAFMEEVWRLWERPSEFETQPQRTIWDIPSWAAVPS